jgi:hypothetical protein
MFTRCSELPLLRKRPFRPLLLVAWLAGACGPAPGANEAGGAGAAGAPRLGGGSGGAVGGQGAAGGGGTAGSVGVGTGGSAATAGVGGSGGVGSGGVAGSGLAGTGLSQGGAGLGGGAQGGGMSAGAAPLGGEGGGVAGHAGATSSAGGVAGAGGDARAGGAGQSGSGGRAGSSSGGSGQAGGTSAGAGGGASGPFVCNQLTGSKLSEEWFIAGFEDVVDDARWQVKWREDAYLEEWANPSSSFWSAGIDSTCAKGTSAPDRIVFGVVSWKYKTQADWRTAVTQTVNTFKAKYPSMLRMDLVTQIRGPNNMLCPTAPTAGETIVVPPELDAALDDVAAAFPGLVFVGPKSVAHSCSEFQGGGPHLTPAGNSANVAPFATYFAQLQ